MPNDYVWYTQMYTDCLCLKLGVLTCLLHPILLQETVSGFSNSTVMALGEGLPQMTYGVILKNEPEMGGGKGGQRLLCIFHSSHLLGSSPLPPSLPLPHPQLRGPAPGGSKTWNLQQATFGRNQQDQWYTEGFCSLLSL